MKIKSSSIKDIKLISALTQESITCLDWIENNKNTFDIFLNRFCWDQKIESKKNIRTNSILFINNVQKVNLKNPPQSPYEFITLLSCCLDSTKNLINLIFNNNFEVNILGKNLEFCLEDISDSFETNTSALHFLKQE